METILDKLRKIDALARSGVAGEKDTAQRMLAALCEKHGVTPEQLAGEEKFWIAIRYKGPLERKLLNHCVLFVAQSGKVRHYHDRNVGNYELTAAQGIDVRECFAHYRKEFARDQETLLSALIGKHQLFEPSDENEPRKELNAEERAELRRMVQMTMGMTSTRWQKPALTLTR